MQQRALYVLLSLLALYFIWGSTYLAIRIAIETCPPLLMAGLRFLLAGAGLFAWLWWQGQPVPGWRQWLASAAIGALLLGGGNGGVTLAEQWVESGLAAVWIATMPLWAALFAGLWGRWPGRLEWAGLLLGLIGVGLLNLEGNLRAHPLGALLLTIATVTWAFGSVWSRRLPLPAGLMSSAAQMLCGGALLTLAGWVSGERLTAWPSERSLLAWGYLVLFGSLVAYSAYAYLLTSVRPALATSYAYVNPVVAVLLGVALAGERIGPSGLAAMAIILAAVALVALGRERGTPPESGKEI